MELTPKIENTIKSSMIQQLNIIVQGVIKQIQDQTLVIVKEEKSLRILINQKTHISVAQIPKLFHSQPSSSSHAHINRKEIDFKTLKTGDCVNIFAEIKSDGLIEAKSITLTIFLE